MLAYIWPIALVVLANTFYQICAKEVPGNIDPFASLTITYLVAAVFSLILFFTIGNGGSLIGEYHKLNWSSFVLGLSIVGLELGFIFAYKAGWAVSTAQVVQSVILAAILIFVGVLFYNEAITWNKIVGIIVCLGGLFLINMK